MKTETEIREMAITCEGAAVTQFFAAENDDMTPTHRSKAKARELGKQYAIVSRFLAWVLDEWEPKWTPEEKARLRKMAKAQKLRRKARDN